ncbi:hypothetical protein [Yoonia sp. R2-816]|uniref:hypothetical protein n=1 Tax=Yoonia sp. R2-816 TaxID=3342638 RepID=UPI00372C37DA
MSKRNDLKKRAAELEITFKGNISNDALEELIKEAEAAQDTGAVASNGEKDSGQIGAPTPPPGESSADAVAPGAADAAAQDGAVQPGAATGATEATGAAPQDTPPATHATEGTQSGVPSELASGVVVRIVGPKKGRWRAGRHFGKQPVDVPIDDLDNAARVALIADPTLTLQLFEDGEPLTDAMQGGGDPEMFEQAI